MAGFNVWKDVTIGALDNPFEAMKYLADDFLLLLVGTGISVFVGWRLESTINSDVMGLENKFLLNLWVFVLKWVSPISLLTIWTLGNLQILFGISFLI